MSASRSGGSRRRCARPTPCASATSATLSRTFKSLGEIDVGDTITGSGNPAHVALPGYRKAVPMVYCGLYPNEGVEYADLRDALDKLKLNDAALVYEPESSVALGFGFRCGFLGLLHMEIVQERLERDYSLDLIATSPSVVFRVTKTDGEVAHDRQPFEAACAQPDSVDRGALRQGDDHHAARLRRRDHGDHAESTRRARGTWSTCTTAASSLPTRCR